MWKPGGITQFFCHIWCEITTFLMTCEGITCRISKKTGLRRATGVVAKAK